MSVRAILQLTLVHVGVSLTVVPITGTLNRIMIADMALPAVLVGLLVALPYMLSPLQVFVGNWADRRPIWGMHRSPWILLGGLMASCGSYATAHAAFYMDEHFAAGLLAAFAVFLVWGIGVNVASVSYLSLASELTERSPKTWRTAAVGVMWTAMILSTIVASIALSRVLQSDASPTGVITAFGAVWLVATLFVVIGSTGIEPSRAESPMARHTANNPLEALQVLAHNATAKRFFIYLLLVLIGVRAQDVLLEPYAADALGMSVSETTRLEALWGIGVFITLLGGMGLVRLFGKRLNIYVGGLVAIVSFGLVILAGAIGNIPFFLIAVFLLGLASGLMTVSNLSFMLDMTVPQNVGLYMGAWGVANFVAQSLGNVGGALMRDVAYWVSGNVALGYMTVFGIEMLGVALSLLLFRTITVEQFQRDAQLELVDVLAATGD
ncbi:BCD family MFS transporter [Caldilinea sp.]|jgi:BCD family chlorophyll transporter-like MFS transporter|uniref:BCD family MFS transporter n=1 Tax=Caldilinea sp. TaxID=2293560 RepID=UPI00262AD2C0|nr:BCD family MFS transporter [uncultured Caldilinea sp.]